MWVFFAVLTVLFWGTSDVMFKNVSDRGEADELILIAMNGTVYGVACLVYWVLTGTVFSFASLVKYIPIAAIYIGSMLFYYKMLPHIKISLASPIANSSCVVTTMLCVLVLGQSVSPLQAGAIALIVLSIIILSLDREPQQPAGLTARDYAVGIGCALIYFVLDGVGSFMDDNILDATLTAEDVIIAYGLCYLLVGVIAMFAAARKSAAAGRKLDFSFALRPRTLLGCLVETAGQFTYVYCYAAGDAALASPFIASFSAVSILLSRIFLKEKLTAKQAILVLAMLAGMFILAIE
ncbi:MAG: EamA family transporter [Oscillospiraceae bacterium]|nr:EamA family transporter [Oscillospiraceae bacterium]